MRDEDYAKLLGRLRCTLGERIADRVLLDPRWFRLHGTGVFYRQGAGR